MRVNAPERGPVLRKTKRYSAIGGAAAVDRVRCVLHREGRYLFVQHDARRRENRGKWSLPGGRLKGREAPRVGLRRELAEELQLRLPYLIEVGDWWHRDENHRIFGCELARDVDWFNTDEILAIAWLTYDEVRQLGAADRLRTGFELAAIAEYQRKHSD